MGMTDDNLLYLATLRTVTLWTLNRVAVFWNTARNSLTRLALTHGENKTTRVLAFGDDSRSEFKTYVCCRMVLLDPNIIYFCLIYRKKMFLGYYLFISESIFQVIR